MLAAVRLTEELESIAAAAKAHARAGEEVAGVLVAEPTASSRLYLCAFEDSAGERSWLALDAGGQPVENRAAVRDAVSISALCEVAEETAVAGDLDELRSRLVALRLTDDPPGLDEAEEAVLALQRTIGAAPRVASPAYLDALGTATRRVELALGERGAPFAEAMKVAQPSVETLTSEIESSYKRTLK